MPLADNFAVGKALFHLGDYKSLLLLLTSPMSHTSLLCGWLVCCPLSDVLRVWKVELLDFFSCYLAPSFLGSRWQPEKLSTLKIETLEYKAVVTWRILLVFCIFVLRLIFHSCTAQHALNIPCSQHFWPEKPMVHPRPQVLAINSQFIFSALVILSFSKVFHTKSKCVVSTHA